MAVTSVYDPRLSATGLLPLWETHQNQQVSLTQASLKLLFLPWVSEFVRFCVSFKDWVFFLQPSSSPQSNPYWPSKSNVLGACLPGAGPLGQGA